jgi:Fe-S-cluster containining protein
VKGDVWASPEDATRLAEHLGVDLKTLSEIYGKREVEGWIQMKDKPEGGCIFLADDGKACGVYEGRPVQVRGPRAPALCMLPFP